MSAVNTFPPASAGGGGITGDQVPAYEINYTEVATYADLPAANTQPNEVYIVRQDTGTWLLGTKNKSGLYYSNGVSWSYMGNSISLDDTASSNESVYSSAKVVALLSGKSDTTHNHSGVYEPADGTILKESDIGTLVQAYNANNAVTNTAQTFSGAQRGSVTAITYGATITPDFSANNHFSCTLTGNVIVANPTNMVVGQQGSITLVQDGTGGRTVAWGNYFKWVGGTAPTYVTTANSKSTYEYQVVSSTEIIIVPLVDWK